MPAKNIFQILDFMELFSLGCYILSLEVTQRAATYMQAFHSQLMTELSTEFQVVNLIVWVLASISKRNNIARVMQVSPSARCFCFIYL